MPEPLYSKRRLTRFLLLVALLVTAVTSAAYLARPSFITSTENRTNDLVMALGDAHPPSGSIAIVDIDERSLARYGQWPWPRSLLAHLLEEIEGAGARAIGLDIIVAEPDRTTSLQEGARVERGHELRASAPPAAPRETDLSLAKTLAKGNTVLGYEFLFDGAGQRERPCQLHPPSVVWVSSGAPPREPLFFVAHDVVCNLPLFTAAVKRSGFLNATPDADGLLRRVPILIQFGDHLYPSLELATLLLYEGRNQIDIVRKGSGGMTVRVGQRSIPIDAQGQMLVRFSSRSGEIPRISADALLRGEFQPEKVRNRIVLVGSSAAGLEPAYQTFAGRLRSHVAIHAQVLDNLLTGRQVIRTAGILQVEVLVGLAAAAATALAVAWSGFLLSALICLALLACTWLGMGMLFEARSYLFSPLLPTALIVLNYAALTVGKGWKIELAARRAAHRALLRLKESEKRLSTIVGAVPDIIFSIDRDCRFLFVSPAVAKYGLPPESLVGRPILPYIRKRDRAPFLRSAGEVFGGGLGDVDFEAARRRVGEGQVWLDVHMVPLRGEAGEIVAILGVARDITDRKKAEKALAEKQHQLEELNASLKERVAKAVLDIREKDQILIVQGRQAAMGEMISNIAHQWRQPLNTLGLVVQELLLTHRRREFTRESLEESVDRAMQLIMHMSQTIDDFRNYFRKEDHKMLFTAGEAVAQTLSLIEPTLRTAGIEVKVVTSEDCEIYGYLNGYSQVLLNILLNSRDAFETSAAPRQRFITITISKERGRSVVTVSDNAGGIPEEVLPKVFDPYFTTKGPDKGTGIGLYMAKAIIEKNMGGRLTARNAASGAQFSIEV